MEHAKDYAPLVPGHRTAESEAAVWILIVILFGISCFAVISLLEKVAG